MEAKPRKEMQVRETDQVVMVQEERKEGCEMERIQME